MIDEKEIFALALEYRDSKRINGVSSSIVQDHFTAGFRACEKIMMDRASVGFNEHCKDVFVRDVLKPSLAQMLIHKSFWQAAKLSAFRDVKFTNEQYLAKEKEIQLLKEVIDRTTEEQSKFAYHVHMPLEEYDALKAEDERLNKFCEEFNRLNEENEALKSAWNEIKEAHGDPVKFYDECKRLKAENERLNKFCKEFVYGEENPQYYKTMDEKLSTEQEKVRVLKEAVEFYADRYSYSDRKSGPYDLSVIRCEDMEGQVAGARAREALKKIEEMK
jgi:hypothetical protein